MTCVASASQENAAGTTGISAPLTISNAWDEVPSTYLCRPLVTTSTSFKDKPPPNDPPDLWNNIMPAVKERACTILGEFERAQSELVGKAVILTDGKAGTVESVGLDEIHGLRVSIRGHDGKWPICTIKFMQPD